MHTTYATIDLTPFILIHLTPRFTYIICFSLTLLCNICEIINLTYELYAYIFLMHVKTSPWLVK